MNKTPALYGGSMDSHDISSKLADNFNRLSAEAALTERERYVVYLIMKGITTTTITMPQQCHVRNTVSRYFSHGFT